VLEVLKVLEVLVPPIDKVGPGGQNGRMPPWRILLACSAALWPVVSSGQGPASSRVVPQVPGLAAPIATAHLEMTESHVPGSAAPGRRVTLVLHIAPKPGMHIYAPGAASYQAVRLRLDANPLLRPHPLQYPASEIYYFAPLKERVPVFRQPFRLTQEVTVLATPPARAALDNRTSLAVAGVLEYQACDDKICYRPASVPVTWSIPLDASARPKPALK
jgi:hypothetical protein